VSHLIGLRSLWPHLIGFCCPWLRPSLDALGSYLHLIGPGNPVAAISPIGPGALHICLGVTNVAVLLLVMEFRLLQSHLIGSGVPLVMSHFSGPGVPVIADLTL
jgi:hypothetical protein